MNQSINIELVYDPGQKMNILITIKLNDDPNKDILMTDKYYYWWKTIKWLCQKWNGDIEITQFSLITRSGCYLNNINLPDKIKVII